MDIVAIRMLLSYIQNDPIEKGMVGSFVDGLSNETRDKILEVASANGLSLKSPAE